MERERNSFQMSGREGKKELQGDKGEGRVCCKDGRDMSTVKQKQEKITKRKWIKMRERRCY